MPTNFLQLQAFFGGGAHLPSGDLASLLSYYVNKKLGVFYFIFFIEKSV